MTLTASCSTEGEEVASPVTDAPTTVVPSDPTNAPPSTVIEAAVTEAPTTTAPAVMLGTEPVSPQPHTTRPHTTLPPVTAPPSDLLTDVTAAYDAAMLAYDRASATPEGDLPNLQDFICCAHLPRIRALMRRERLSGIISANDTTNNWRRIEAITQLAPDDVDLEVCRNTEIVDTDIATGQQTRYPLRVTRYIDSMRLIDGVWKWWAREWVDPSPDYSDCSPRP